MRNGATVSYIAGGFSIGRIQNNITPLISLGHLRIIEGIRMLLFHSNRAPLSSYDIPKAQSQNFREKIHRLSVAASRVTHIRCSQKTLGPAALYGANGCVESVGVTDRP